MSQSIEVCQNGQVNLELTGEPELVDGSKIERLVGVTSGSQESELEVE
jgi:hypothetical protein